MKFLNEYFKIFHIDAYLLRGEKFYNSIVSFREKILPLQKHRVLKPENFICTLCKNHSGKLFLEWVEGYQLFECNFCNAISPNISVDDEVKHIESVYGTDDYYEKIVREIHKQYQYRKNTFGKDRYTYIVERLNLNPRKVKILDVGCGAGYFLSVLKDMGISHKGLEVAPHLIRYCKELGLNVDANSIHEEPDEEYDVISLFDVLEHLADPIAIFKIINKKIKPGGFCIIFTPNIHSVGYELMGAKQNTLVPFEHLCFFNRNSFKYLCAQTSFLIHSLETFGLDITDYLLLKEYEDNFPYTKKLKEMVGLIQGIIDKNGLSNHFRLTLKK